MGVGGRHHLPSPFSVPDLTILCLPLSLNGDLGGAFGQSIAHPRHRFFKTRSLWISLPISFFNPDSC